MIFSGGLVGPESATAPIPSPLPKPPTSTRDLPAGLPTADDFELGVAKVESPVTSEPVTPAPLAAPAKSTARVSIARALMPWKKA